MLESQLNSLQNTYTKKVELVPMDSDFGREILYKMSLSLNLPISSDRTKIQ